ncbi:MAG: methyltransferase [Prevotella sp.]|jgi:tRNA1Val (adenine37-N6)-methyltransferase|nr:methyltransferase [Prevotella sp.]MCI1247229.1 methyltransferase [Prevotella sp.]
MKEKFTFQHFVIRQDRCAMKVGTDGVLLGSWAGWSETVPDRPSIPFRRVLDIGTGTGVIALMLAQRFPEVQVDALEIDRDACLQAAENAKESPFADRLRVIGKSLQDFCRSEPTPHYDLIVSNPPFYSSNQFLESPDAKRDQARRTGTLTYTELFKGVKQLLEPNGVFCTVIPSELAEPFSAEGYLSGLVLTRRCLVKTVERKAAKRCLLAFARQRTFPLEDEMGVLMTPDGKLTDWWARLSQDFYLTAR